MTEDGYSYCEKHCDEEGLTFTSFASKCATLIAFEPTKDDAVIVYKNWTESTSGSTCGELCKEDQECTEEECCFKRDVWFVSFGDIITCLGAGLIIQPIVSFLQTISLAKSFAKKPPQYQIDPTQVSFSSVFWRKCLFRSLFLLAWLMWQIHSFSASFPSQQQCHEQL